MNIDNYPSHAIRDPESDEDLETYAAASKQWCFVYPTTSDNKSLHYVGEDRVFLICKNKYTGEWEFPISKMHSLGSNILQR